jgi:hypothetical protein
LLSARQALKAWLETIPLALFCPIDPLKFRKAIFDHFHNIAHPGRLASRSIISSGLCGVDFPATSPPGLAGVWPASGARSTDTRLAPQPIPEQRFSNLHVDLVGPLQYSNNLNYIFTIIARTSK